MFLVYFGHIQPNDLLFKSNFEHELPARLLKPQQYSGKKMLRVIKISVIKVLMLKYFKETTSLIDNTLSSMLNFLIIVMMVLMVMIMMTLMVM